ncbi:DUF4842 domain-containing protein [Bacteroides sp.]|uniref:DUF4842 domain-containing protein n=1 Tax=Bacteroides sp. TaxID=29523 RepID=UPI00262A215E|nr:DUF4842 domain-containing protein [Bacteroides sp.]
MNRKKTSLCYLFLAFLLGGVFVLTSCDKGNDVYNPNHIQEEAKKAFPVKDIDPNQTWEMSSICNASVSVNEKTGGAYTIKVYTENPYNTNGNAFLLAKTSVTDGQTVNFKFDIPLALQYVYVMKVNSEGYSSTKTVFVTDKKIDVSFGGANTVAMAAKTRAVSSIVNFTTPDVNDVSIFPTKESIQQLSLTKTDGQIANAANYRIDSSVKSINNWGSNAKMYVTENTTLSSLYIAGNSKLYILPGVTLTLTDNKEFSLSQSGSIISVGSGATFNVNSKYLQASIATIYNLGTINAKAIDIAGSGYIYNSGTLDIENEINTSNDNALLVNEGVIKASSLETKGSSSFYNSGEVTISGKTFLSSGSQKWENQGYFNTNNMEIKASSPYLLNACKLYVEEEFKISVSQAAPENNFNVDGGAYVECGSLYLNNATVNMGGKSFFNVLGTATYEYNTRGFYSITNDFALLKIGKAVQASIAIGHANSIGYHGKLYIACKNHFENGSTGGVPYIIVDDDAQMTGADNADIKIPSSTCNPGYNSTPDEGGKNDKVIEYAYAFEDMMLEAGDYDFNDVVLYVTAPFINEGGERVIDVTLKAAGATKKLAVIFNDGTTTTTLFENVHTALKVAEGTIVNTGGTTGTPSTVAIKVGDNFNLTNNGDLYISDGKRDVHIPNFTPGFKVGDAPYALRIAYASWKWPKERNLITEAYPDFADWAKNAMEAPNWYNNFNSDKVIGIE